MVTLLENSAPALRVEGLRKAYDDVVAVDGLNLQVEAGECFGLLGPNGAGKTTTIEICEGLLAADSGSVEVLGRRWESDADDLRELLGIQLQDTQLSEKLTVDETLTLFQSFYRDARDVGEVIDQVELGEKRDSRTIVLTTHYMEEAERLCDRVAIVDHGRIIALGTPQELIDKVDVSHLPPPEPRKTSATLEDVFVSLTGRTLRDE